jgi:hypothetical protein
VGGGGGDGGAGCCCWCCSCCCPSPSGGEQARSKLPWRLQARELLGDESADGNVEEVSEETEEVENPRPAEPSPSADDAVRARSVPSSERVRRVALASAAALVGGCM